VVIDPITPEAPFRGAPVREQAVHRATVCILPARDGYATISPRDDRQWAAWVRVMGSPDWAQDSRFASKPDRVANWDALYALMSVWSRELDKQAIADMAQAAHVPSFPLREPIEQPVSPQLAHRSFWWQLLVDGRTVGAPGSAVRAPHP
jgi:crotonobetainyl-CoA:carnitine CoA-transferase CaiB-like acyl-CoA transferase